MTVQAILESVIRAIGIQGVSFGILLPLISVAIYTHKATTVGGVVVSAGSMIAHDLKVIAIVLTIGLVLGVISMDPNRLSELIEFAQQEMAQAQFLEQLRIPG